MSARGGLVVILVLTLTTGCRDSSGENAPAADVTVASEILPANVAENVAAIEVVATPRPSPEVTVRAQPAPLGSLDLPPSPDAAQVTAFPQEVTSFMVDRDSCDHFRGEQPTDGERRVFLTESIAELCTGTDARLALLRKRYADDPSVMAALRGYDRHIEAQP